MSTTVVRGNTLDDWLAERRRLGLDGRDELWEGVLHVPPHPTWAHAALHDEIKAVLRGPARAAGLVSGAGFALGEPDDYRVPDGGWVPAAQQGQLYMPTATVVLEVLSPDDETFARSSTSTASTGCGRSWWRIRRSDGCAAGRSRPTATRSALAVRSST